MLNQRGSALLNVMAVVAMLLILGFGLMQAINSDAILAVRDADVTHAIQMAEGGIDYGIEMLIAGPDDVLGELNWPVVGSGTPFVIEVEEGEVEVLIEEIVPGKQFLITSKSYRKNAVRQIKAYVTHYGDAANPFAYSLFIGGAGSEELELKNLTIHGSVYIAAEEVVISNVTFNGDVHFASKNVIISGNSKLNMLQAKATREEHTVVTVQGGSAGHWANFMEVVADEQTLPDVNISGFLALEGFHDWKVDEVPYTELKRLNFFDRDVTIVFENNHPIPDKMVVACTGSVTFRSDQGQYQTDINRTLIVMAEENIYDVDKISVKAGKPKVDLYLYSKGVIETAQNIYPSSIMAEWIGSHPQNYSISAPNPAIFEDLPDEIRQAWGSSGYRITRWEN